MLKRIINLGAVYYTVISAVFLAFAKLFGDANTGLDPAKFLFILLFSFVMSTGTAIKESDIMGKLAKGICHAICYIGGFFFCMVLPYHKGFSFSVIATVIFAVLYIVACLTKSFVTRRASEKTAKTKTNSTSKPTQKSPKSNKKSKAPEAQTEYKSLFSDDK